HRRRAVGPPRGEGRRPSRGRGRHAVPGGRARASEGLTPPTSTAGARARGPGRPSPRVGRAGPGRRGTKDASRGPRPRGPAAGYLPNRLSRAEPVDVRNVASPSPAVEPAATASCAFLRKIAARRLAASAAYRRTMPTVVLSSKIAV